MGGRLVFTSGINSLPDETVAQIISFNAFDEGNDPYGEHDFGQIEVDGVKVFFKVDYYHRAMRFHSPDASDPEVTQRVLTVVLAEEY